MLLANLDALELLMPLVKKTADRFGEFWKLVDTIAAMWRPQTCGKSRDDCGISSEEMPRTDLHGPRRALLFRVSVFFDVN